jgi:DNA-binding SARP family transcriptional activator
VSAAMPVEGHVFRVLGPLEFSFEGRAVTLSSGKQRTLLAALLLNANMTVSLDQLIHWLWDSDPPERPRSALHTYMARLRRHLRTPASPAEPGPRIHTSAAGYRIEIADDMLDLLRFRDLRSRAAWVRKQGRPEAEADLLAEALALWRGPLLSEIGSESLRHEVIPGLNEELLQALDRHHEVRLELGRHGALIGELRTLIRRFPFHERLWYHLMAALHRSGRRAEAIQTFDEVSAYLRDQLGITPSRELHALRAAILDGDQR